MRAYVQMTLSSGTVVQLRTPPPREDQTIVEWSRMIAREQTRLVDAHSVVIERDGMQMAIRGACVESVAIVHERSPLDAWYLTCIRDHRDDYPPLAPVDPWRNESNSWLEARASS